MANDNKPNPNRLKVSPWIIYGAIILIFIFISIFTGGSNFEEAAKTTSSKFNTYLEKGEVAKVIVYNKSEAEVYLNEKALSSTLQSFQSLNFSPLSSPDLYCLFACKQGTLGVCCAGQESPSL